MKKLLIIVGVIFFIGFIGSYFTDEKAKPIDKKTKVAATLEKELSPEEIAANKKAGEKAKLEIRKAYESSLRTSYLDNNLDIQVDVKGKRKDILELKFALFNDVWTRKMETSGNFEEWHKMGFKKIVVTDGYDYNKEFTWSN